MRITIVAVGKLKERYWQDAAAEYLKRLGPYASVDVVEVPDRDVTRDESRALADEATAILRAIPDSSRVLLLDAGGATLSSDGLADHLSALMVGGVSHVTFIIGGAAGVDASVRDRAAERISLGSMTWPHQMVRVMLLEQVYRAFRIMRGEPYHR